MGITASMMAKHMPMCPILAVCVNDWAAKSLMIQRGIFSIRVGSQMYSDTMINSVIEDAIKKLKLIKKGDKVVVTNGMLGGVGSTNLLKILEV
mmetsp:Transcript_27883/g.26923  ORF Transcript_27883/g.26923 Transcript_27883/m.26923 type:complete len:93 (-) Transcript_27883:22-300(-)